MAEFMGNNKKRLTINLSLFAPNDYNTATKSTAKSPKSFEPNGVVGLGIVAAMNELDQNHDPISSAKSSRAAILAASPRSTPIPIGSAVYNSTASAKFGGGEGRNSSEEDERELSEGYTCVISHIGNNMIKKREYFDDNLANESEGRTTRYCLDSKFFSASPPPSMVANGDAAAAMAATFQTEDYLNSCYLCKKNLQGLDIFMYRGEKAFCSTECRCKQISIDERKEKRGSGKKKPLAYSVSPCSSPMQFFVGVAAA